MARILANQLAIGAQWETLIGLEKELTEIRTLARSRDASHYAVADDDAGTRTAGLFSLPDVAPTPDASPPYALAAALTALVDAPNVAFVHPDPDDPAASLFVTLRDRRPQLDRVVPAAEVRALLEQWGSEIDGAVQIAGIAPLSCPGADVTLSLDDIVAYVRKERPRDGRLSVVRKRLPARQVKIAAVVFATVTMIGGAGWWGWSWYDEREQAKLAAANRVDPVDAYKSSLARAIAAEPFSAGASYARRLQAAIQTLPASAGGWRPAGIDCDTRQCEIRWQRQEGGTFDLLLSHRPQAQIVDLDNATEVLIPSALPAATAAPAPTSGSVVRVDDKGFEDLEDFDDGDARVTPVPRAQFLRSAGARLQSLGDYGMDISLSMPTPLVNAPPAVTARPDVPPPIAKGEWKIAGHLAFIDSVAGLMMRAGNMSLQELKVVIDDNKPVFTAQGTYYVH
ncbi:type 4b pilus protein PilO2 [Pandoraea sp. NPDC087047]|uniref:type 4b pilus protein PilO2 n=1 Tax=Pandoraea sp. NPDC087047 TaxID=3364390 RepID=UPI00381680CA